MNSGRMTRENVDRHENWLARLFVVVLTVAFGATNCPAQAPSSEVDSLEAPDFKPKELKGVGVEEHLESLLPLNLKFRDDEGKEVRLKDYFGKGRPVVLSMNYSSCPMLCNVQLTGLATALGDVPLVAGTEYDVVSVSIDPAEKVERAAETKKRYVELYGKKNSSGGWHFLVGDQDSITQLAQAIGFQYHYVESRKEYAHPAVFVLASPDGKISRYVYGVSFDPKVLRLSLVDASEGRVGSTTDRFLLFCFHYDAAEGKFAPKARNLMKIGGAVTVVGMAIMLGFFWNREWRRKVVTEQHPPIGVV